MRLIVGNLNYSSWSTRPWLALDHAGASFTLHKIGVFEDPEWLDKVRMFSGAGKVPILVDGPSSIHESLAICEYVNERFPDATLWPRDMRLRARARAISQEMATSFTNVRREMPFNFRARAKSFVPSEAARAEIDRIFEIWSASLETSGGPFLFGTFTIADCMYFPVAGRFRTYGVELPPTARRYAEALFDHPSVKKLAELAKNEPPMPIYDAHLG